jgi:ribosomal-protein-alanine N-acetyltransferase
MALFPTAIESPRLRYEVIHSDYFDPYEMYEHAREGAPGIEEITKWVTWGPHQHPKETMEFVEQVGEQFDENQGVDYAIYPRDGEDDVGEFAGACNLSVDWDHRRGNLGVWFRKPFWGRGYSGERARTIVALAFDVLDLEVVAVTHAPDNEKSQRAIEKYVDAIGGRKEGLLRNTLVMGGEPRDTVRYSITAAEWQDATGGEYDATFEW